MSRPTIVHVVRSLEVGGLENGVVNVVNASGTRFEHVVVCTTTDGPLRERLQADIRLVCLGRRPGRDLGALLRLARLLHRLRPAAVHSRNWPTFDTVLAARLAGVPVVIHGEHGREIADPEGRNPRRNRIRRALAPLVTRFVTVSQDLGRWLVEDVGISATKVTTILNGVDTDRFDGSRRDAARAALGLSAQTLVFGTVGRLDPVKDQASLLHALAALRTAHPDAMVLVAGDGPCRDALDQLARELGIPDRVRLLGERHDIPAVLAAMDVFVLPSIAEGISNTILEAMATGLPVVATRVGGNPELVEDGVTGGLVPKQDPPRLAAAIGRYLGDERLRQAHGGAARLRAETHFSLGRMRRDYEALYASLTGAAAGKAA